jgi:hypothetical protein
MAARSRLFYALTGLAPAPIAPRNAGSGLPTSVEPPRPPSRVRRGSGLAFDFGADRAARPLWRESCHDVAHAGAQVLADRLTS